jgi:hypothetical protein
MTLCSRLMAILSAMIHSNIRGLELQTNARRSGIYSEIRESILGHSDQTLDVSERYGIISDDELVNANDRFTYDHGLTQILVAARAGKWNV